MSALQAYPKIPIEIEIDLTGKRAPTDVSNPRKEVILKRVSTNGKKPGGSISIIARAGSERSPDPGPSRKTWISLSGKTYQLESINVRSDLLEDLDPDPNRSERSTG